MTTPRIDYVATATGAAFHADDSRIRMILGPVGAGKTVIGLMDIPRKALTQPANRNGVRQTRFAVIRQSYPQLVSTVIKTFEEWLGELGEVTYGVPITWKTKFKVGDGTMCEIEVMFLALERAEDANKLRSLEVSHAMISEAAEIPREIFDMLQTRIGRYPAARSGVKCHNPSVWMESNPPSVRSHWYELFEQIRPDNARMFRQPPALLYDEQAKKYSPNPLAENIENLAEGYDYYMELTKTASKQWLDIYVLGQYGTDYSGTRIYPEYDDDAHVAPHIMKPASKAQLVVGMDFGLNAAAAITQLSPTGQLLCLAEVTGKDEMFEEFLEKKFLPTMGQQFFGWPFIVIGDPSENAGMAAYSMLRQRGIACQRAYTNEPRVRWDAVKWFLNRRNGFALNADCTLLREGFNAGYHFKKQANSRNDRHTGHAEKNEVSHPHDGLQYAALYHRQAGTMRKPKPAQGRSPFLWV